MQEILLGSTGLDPSQPQYDLQIPQHKRIDAEHALNDLFNGERPNRLVGLNIGTSEKGRLKRWDGDSFADLSLRLARRYPNVGVVLLSGPEDETPRRQLAEAMPANVAPNIRIMRHDLEVGDFLATVGTMDAVVTSDTFAMHASRAQDVPVLVLAGPMPAKELEILPSDSMIGPKLECSPCYYRCDRATVGECMSLIQVDEVELELIRLLNA